LHREKIPSGQPRILQNQRKLPSRESNRCLISFSIPQPDIADERVRSAVLMGWKLSVLALLFAIWALLIGALIIGIPILLYLFFRVWSNRSKGKAGGTGRSHWINLSEGEGSKQRSVRMEGRAGRKLTVQSLKVMRD
jgi:hypothetical protein